MRPSPPVQQVFIPVDDQRKPTGTRYYVPEQLYRALYRLADAAEAKPRGWLIQSAKYRGSLDWAVGQKRLQLGQLQATYQITVLGSNQQIKIPLDRSQVEVTRELARLDGRPIPLT